MVDERTLDFYEEHAQSLFDRSSGFDRSPVQSEIEPFLIPGGLSADIGCGTGADLAWLNSIGCPAVGFEPSSNRRRLAMRRYVDLDIRSDFLPDLTSIKDGRFQNVLCLAVLMHLPADALPGAVSSLSRILAPGGRLIASWRPTIDGELRESNGRLFSPIDFDAFRGIAVAAGLSEVAHWQQEDPHRPGIVFTTFVAEKRNAP